MPLLTAEFRLQTCPFASKLSAFLSYLGTEPMPTDHQTITQKSLFIEPWANPATKRLPGVNLLDWNDWLLVDDAFSKQVAYRDMLLLEKRSEVFDVNDCAFQASTELLAKVIENLKSKPDYNVLPGQVTRPDGVTVQIHADHPLVVAGRLVQQDFCLLERGQDEHILRGAVLCFPTNWRLNEKINRPMSAIHEPVSSYDSEIAHRVQRIFDNIRPANPMWRANYLLYNTANLFQPNREVNRDRRYGKWVRVERQSLVLLPETRFIVFGIHTNIVHIDTLSPAKQAAFLEAWESKHHYEVSASASIQC
jgi:hypothetical protein